ncbi:MAG: hypothetical protein HEEMFOPI_01490 [Holosporales bacterium]
MKNIDKKWNKKKFWRCKMLKDINDLECRIIKCAMICAIVYVLSPDSAHATKVGDIQGIETIWDTIKPYFTWAFSLGGISYCGLNLRKVLIGDYRAAAPAALAALVAGVGVNGLFKEQFVSVLLP